MRSVIQRVKSAKVEVGGAVVGQIGAGMLVLLGVGRADTEETAKALVQKLVQLRIFEDEQGKMNVAGLDCGAEFLVVSQFTLYGDCRKGRRPSFDAAAVPEKAKALYDYFVQQLRAAGLKVETGEFAAMMDVHLINDGPVTFIVDND